MQGDGRDVETTTALAIQKLQSGTSDGVGSRKSFFASLPSSLGFEYDYDDYEHAFGVVHRLPWLLA
jgi:hypothetical protein